MSPLLSAAGERSSQSLEFDDAATQRDPSQTLRGVGCAATKGDSFRLESSPSSCAARLVVAAPSDHPAATQHPVGIAEVRVRRRQARRLPGRTAAARCSRAEVPVSAPLPRHDEPAGEQDPPLDALSGRGRRGRLGRRGNQCPASTGEAPTKPAPWTMKGRIPRTIDISAAMPTAMSGPGVLSTTRPSVTGVQTWNTTRR
jgi:hypothetical protein